MDQYLPPATLQQIQIFVTVAENLSLRQTAQELMIDQSKVTKELKKLEEILEFPLFEYHESFMRLTSMGSACYRSWIRIIPMVEQGFSRAISCDSDNHLLAVGTSYGVNYENMYMTFVENFQSRHSDVVLTVKEDGMHQLVESLAKQELDIIIVPDTTIYSLSSHIYQWKYLIMKPLSILVSSRNPLAQRESVRMADILDIPLICLDPTVDPNTLSFLRNLFWPYGKVPAIVSYYRSNYEINELLEESNGLCIVGSYFSDTLVKGCTRVVIEDRRGGLVAVWNKNQGKENVEHFLDLIDEQEKHGPQNDHINRPTV